MVKLLDIQHQAEKLSSEDREGLLAYLIHDLSHPPVGVDDAEILQREAEMDSGVVQTVSHREFLQQVGRSIE